MSELERVKRKLLMSLYNNCTNDQRDLLKRIYGKVTEISIDDLDNSIRLCEATVKRNNIEGM